MSTATAEQAKRASVIRALKNKIRPYTAADIAMATKLSKRVVRRLLRTLVEDRLVSEKWLRDGGEPFYELTKQGVSQ